MGSRKTKIVPPIRHALDINALRQMRDAVNSLLNSRVVVGTTAQSHHSDSNVVYEIPNSTNGWFWEEGKRVYDHTKTFKTNQVVYVKPDDPMVTAGTIDPDTGEKVFAVAGTYVALQAVAPVVNPASLPAKTYYHIPQLPLPTPDDPDNSDPDLTAYGDGFANNYWWLITADSPC